MADAPSLPTKFPCWCRAVYSWGGESKKDLGFVEGDLIECLNAGDGQWWMGRLRRDKRAMGLFPSNFVKVLDESFVPVQKSNTPTPDPSQSNPPPKGKSIRKPFKSYSAPIEPLKKPNEGKFIKPPLKPVQRAHHKQNQEPYQVPSRQNSYLENTQSPSRQNSFQGHGGGITPLRQNSYLQHGQVPSRQNSGFGSRAPSPSPSMHAYARAASPAPPTHYSARGPSPAPPMNHYSRAASPAPPTNHYSRALSPAPPTNRYPTAPSPAPDMDPYSRGPSPAPPMHYSRAHSPNPYQDVGSSPPPPAPPPHRIAYQPQRTPSPNPSMNGYRTYSRGPSPAPPSSAPHGMTPSPLRDAMDDVMSSLHGMGVREQAASPLPASLRAPSPIPPSPLNPWSPEAFQELNSTDRRLKPRQRTQTTMGFEVDQEQDYHNSDGRHHHWKSQRDPYEPNQAWKQNSHLPASAAYDGPQYTDGFESPEEEMPPPPPPRQSTFNQRPSSSGGSFQPYRPTSAMEAPESVAAPPRKLSSRKSAYELGRSALGRTFTAKSTITNASNGTQSTSSHSTTSTNATTPSLMSGLSAGAFSATSAGSMARRKTFGSFKRSRPQSVAGTRRDDLLDLNRGVMSRPESAFSGPSYHASHASSRPASGLPAQWERDVVESGNPTGGLTTLKPKRSGFFKKLGESFKTGAASARTSIAGGGQGVSPHPVKSLLPNGVTGIASSNAAQDVGLSNGAKSIDWVQVRRDINRSNSLSKMEKLERAERAEVMGQPVLDPIDILEEQAEGDESIDGMAIADPTNFNTVNLQLVDKSSRFVTNLPPMTNPASLAQGYVCRPYRSDVQRFRAIFTWVSEKIAWEEDFEGEVDTRHVIQSLRGCAQEVAILVMEMCQAVGLHAEVVRGFLKPTDELPSLDALPRPNHWWNAVLVDGEWRIMDCSLASPTNPKRSNYSSSPSAAAESFYFLARPLEICYTHIPSNDEQQHIVPAIDPTVLLALPCALPPYFCNSLHIEKYNTALLYLENLDLMHINIEVPPDTELFAEVHARSYACDPEGDLYDYSDTITKRALAQAEWKNGQKRYVVKALLPSDASQGVLHIFAGRRGLMHGIKDNPHPIALSLPIYHAGENPPFDFLTRHPTPHAQRHDLYLAQPQCKTLVTNNTYVFSVRQHPSSLGPSSPSVVRAPSPSPLGRPASSLSMVSGQASNPSETSYFTPGANGTREAHKPAKLAVQAPSGKILRLSRKIEGGLVEEGGTWETIIKVGERGTWRGLVLADRSARWCVWGEWECV
jgi:transglutaminase/protease-like cytokinesis protein 3